MSREADLDAVKKVIRRWARAFGSKDSASVLALWDATYPQILYQAEEYPGPLRGPEDLTHYTKGILGLAQNIRDQSLLDMDVDVIGDMAWCYIRGTITFDVAGLPKPISGQARQTFILRNVGGEWKIIHYHESRETEGLRDALAAAHPRPQELNS